MDDLKFKQFIDIYDLPEEIEPSVWDFVRDSYAFGQNTLHEIDIDDLEEREEFPDAFHGEVKAALKILEFMRERELEELYVFVWW